MYIRELSTFNDLSTLKSDVVPFFMYVPMCVCVCVCVPCINFNVQYIIPAPILSDGADGAVVTGL